MVDRETIDREYGTAAFTPGDDVVAGSFSTWTITYRAGALGVDDGGQLKVASNMSSDWGRPQFDDPGADNFATVETSADATVTAAYDPDGYVRPLKDTVTIDVSDGALAPGDTVTVTLGATGDGSLGHRVQTFPEEGFELAVLVDAFESGEPVRLPEPLTVDVVAGDATKLHAFVPTVADPGTELEVRVRAEDFWGNTADGYAGTLRIDGAGVRAPVAVEARDGVATAEVTLADSGVHRLTVVDAEREELRATTNPVRYGLGDEVGTYWGDIHGQSGETVGTGTIGRYFEYLRDCAHLDFGAHAANDFQVTDAFWETIRETVATTNDPGTFVTFLCYEWSPNTPVGGDHNVYFRGDEVDIHRSSSWQIAEGYDKHRGTHPVSALYEAYRGRDDVLVIPHQGGRPATLDVHDPDLTPFVEIASVWGVFEWFGREAIDRGYVVGFVGGSDDHTGRPGASYPTNEADWSFPIKGPVMAARADDLTRDALWDAFTHRRVYATTGARLFLDVRIDGVPAGGEVAVEGPPVVDVVVNGTAPIRRIDLFRGADRAVTKSFAEGDDLIEVTWTGARSKDRHKVQDWSGGLSISAGRIVDVAEFGFDHPTQGVRDRTDTHVRWKGATAGNHQGLRLGLDVPDDATLTVGTEPATAQVRLGNLGERIVDAGPVGRRLELRRTGRATVTDRSVTLEDDPGPGRHAYYVRIHQEDGEMAWSSPIYVDIG